MSHNIYFQALKKTMATIHLMQDIVAAVTFDSSMERKVFPSFFFTRISRALPFSFFCAPFFPISSNFAKGFFFYSALVAKNQKLIKPVVLPPDPCLLASISALRDSQPTQWFQPFLNHWQPVGTQSPCLSAPLFYVA